MIKKWLPVILAGILFALGYQSIDDIRPILESVGADKPGEQQDGKYDVVLEFPADRYPETAAHIQGAIEKGHSDICTIDRDGAEKNREESLHGIPTREGYDRDEWPMAYCSEGGKGASVKYISPSDNRGAGSWVSHHTRDYPDGTRVKFIVTQPEGGIQKEFHSFFGHTMSMKILATETAWPATRRAFLLESTQRKNKFSRSENHSRVGCRINIACNV